MPLIGIIVDGGDPARADALAAALDLPTLPAPPAAGGLYLALTPERLELRAAEREGPGPVTVDFAATALQRRLRGAGPRSEALARAVGLRQGRPLQVCDTTAGLGRDAYVLAALGARVTLLERNPVIVELLRDGLRRARGDPAADRLRLVQADACDWLPAHRGEFDAVYLDPMYPTATKRGEVKKEIRSLQRLLAAETQDVEALMTAACAARPARVVVKRPRKAPRLTRPPRHFAIDGRHTRFDVHLPG